jgi:UDP-N-acetylmuramate dehydrogenase
MTGLIARLPQVRGRYTENAILAKYTWFGVGGPAEVLFKPADKQDLADFLKNKSKDIPVTVLGVGSNVLVRDGGMDGVVIKLGREFAQITVQNNIITAGAAALDQNVAHVAFEHGLGGLEFLSGIPGTIGGALRMNAGAYTREIKDVLIDADVIDDSGALFTVPVKDLGYTYRHSSAPATWIFVGGRLSAHPKDPALIGTEMDKIRTAREDSQPVRGKTGGSTFTNPAAQKAWELIDKAGCRGLVVGDAQVSEKHCNFLINRGGATAHDIESLGEAVRERVFNKTNVDLTWEIIRLGKPLKNLNNN